MNSSEKDETVYIVKLIIDDIINNKSQNKFTLSYYIKDKLNEYGIKSCYATVSNKFKKHSGETISKYYCNKRIEKAKEMIINGFSIPHICLKLGYSTIHYLSNDFKKSTGMRPTEFRRMGKCSWGNEVHLTQTLKVKD